MANLLRRRQRQNAATATNVFIDGKHHIRGPRVCRTAAGSTGTVASSGTHRETVYMLAVGAVTGRVAVSGVTGGVFQIIAPRA
jgi:hypothetical protein